MICMLTIRERGRVEKKNCWPKKTKTTNRTEKKNDCFFVMSLCRYFSILLSIVLIHLSSVLLFVCLFFCSFFFVFVYNTNKLHMQVGRWREIIILCTHIYINTIQTLNVKQFEILFCDVPKRCFSRHWPKIYINYDELKKARLHHFLCSIFFLFVILSFVQLYHSVHFLLCWCKSSIKTFKFVTESTDTTLCTRSIRYSAKKIQIDFFGYFII